MKKLLSLGLFLAVFLSACASKPEAVVKTNIKTQTLMFSQKQRLEKDGLSMILAASFLNPVLDELKNEDVFIISISPIFDKKLQVFINEQELSVLPLSKNDDLRKYLIENQFTSFFKATKPLNADENELLLKICPQDFDCLELSFQRYSKSLYYRSVDADTQYN